MLEKPQYTPSLSDPLLERLAAVRNVGPGRWIARCPAHEDRHPSLSIKETDDGTILLKCWAGCSAAEVVAAVGLTLRDLFPHAPVDSHHRRPARKVWTALDALRCLAREALVVQIAAEDQAAGKTLDPDDRQRLARAAARLRDALTTVEGR